MSRGDLSEHQLHTALEKQKRNPPRRIGEWLQVLQFATERQVLTGLSLQWALPLLSSPESALSTHARLLPDALRRELRLVPVRFVESTNQLYVATGDQVDYSVLASIEHILGLRILPCLVSEGVLSRWLKGACALEEDPTQHFDRVAGTAELARITSSYATRLNCQDLRIARCRAHIWVRLSHAGNVTHLLFRVPEPSIEADAHPPDFPTAV